MPSLDPTKTSTLRNQYAKAMNRRFLDLSADVRKSFVENLALTVNEPARRGQFDFPTSTEKVRAFQEWLRTQVNSGILEVSNFLPVSGRGHWQNRFIRAAYIRGINDTEKLLKRLGLLVRPVADVAVEFASGIHADTVQLIYSRVFEGLKGITESMSAQLSEIFSRSLIDGVGVRTIAKRITDQIGEISRKRAVVMARTETIRAYSESRLNTMEENGIEGVTPDVEFLTAGDDRVCQKCKALEGKVFTIKQARGIIPVHPRCRCTWVTAQSSVEADAA